MQWSENRRGSIIWPITNAQTHFQRPSSNPSWLSQCCYVQPSWSAQINRYEFSFVLLAAQKSHTSLLCNSQSFCSNSSNHDRRSMCSPWTQHVQIQHQVIDMKVQWTSLTPIRRSNKCFHTSVASADYLTTFDGDGKLLMPFARQPHFRSPGTFCLSSLMEFPARCFTHLYAWAVTVGRDIFLYRSLLS